MCIRIYVQNYMQNVSNSAVIEEADIICLFT